MGFVLHKGVLESFLQERGLPAVVSVGHTQKFSGASPDLVPWGHSWWCSGLMPGSVLRDASGGTQETLYMWCQGSNPVSFESGRWHVGRESELLNVCAWDGILSPAHVPHAFQRLERRSEERAEGSLLRLLENLHSLLQERRNPL